MPAENKYDQVVFYQAFALNQLSIRPSKSQNNGAVRSESQSAGTRGLGPLPCTAAEG